MHHSYFFDSPKSLNTQPHTRSHCYLPQRNMKVWLNFQFVSLFRISISRISTNQKPFCSFQCNLLCAYREQKNNHFAVISIWNSKDSKSKVLFHVQESISKVDK